MPVFLVDVGCNGLTIKDHLSGMEQYSRACRLKKGGRMGRSRTELEQKRSSRAEKRSSSGE